MCLPLASCIGNVTPQNSVRHLTLSKIRIVEHAPRANYKKQTLQAGCRRKATGTTSFVTNAHKLRAWELANKLTVEVVPLLEGNVLKEGLLQLKANAPLGTDLARSTLCAEEWEWMVSPSAVSTGVRNGIWRMPSSAVTVASGETMCTVVMPTAAAGSR